MKRLTIIATMIVSLSAFGHEKDSLLSKSNQKFFIGLSFSPDYCYRTITESNNPAGAPNSFTAPARHQDDSLETAKFGYSVGVVLCFQYNTGFSLETGMQYSNKGYKTIPIETLIDWSRQLYAKAVEVYNIEYLDFPLKLNYSFFKKRTQLIAGMGVTLNVLLSSSIHTIPEDNSYEAYDNFNHSLDNGINFSYNVSLGVKYNLGEKSFLRLEPTYRYGILDIGDVFYKSVYLWSYGLNVCYCFMPK